MHNLTSLSEIIAWIAFVDIMLYPYSAFYVLRARFNQHGDRHRFCGFIIFIVSPLCSAKLHALYCRSPQTCEISWMKIITCPYKRNVTKHISHILWLSKMILFFYWELLGKSMGHEYSAACKKIVLVIFRRGIWQRKLLWWKLVVYRVWAFENWTDREMNFIPK